MAATPEASPTTPDSIETALDAVGDRWTLLILRSIFTGNHRFSALVEDLGIARNLLTDRLAALVDCGILQRVRYCERPPRDEYRLTDKGRGLSPALVALMRWGDEWYAGGQPQTVLVHSECGTPIDLAVRCPGCDLEVAAPGIAATPGPGAQPGASERSPT